MRRPASADPRRKRTLANIKMRRAAGDALMTSPGRPWREKMQIAEGRPKNAGGVNWQCQYIVWQREEQ
jgi:hypothetical protein